MITIIWKIEDITKRRDQYTRKRVTAVRLMKNGEVRNIGSAEDQFAGDFQMLMELLEQKKALPKKAFDKTTATYSYKYGVAWAMKEAKIANCIQM